MGRRSFYSHGGECDYFLPARGAFATSHYVEDHYTPPPQRRKSATFPFPIDEHVWPAVVQNRFLEAGDQEPPPMRRKRRRMFIDYDDGIGSYPNYGADTVRFFLTGAASDGAAQANVDASLGNYRSSTEAKRIGMLHQTAIPGLTAVIASRDNGHDAVGLIDSDTQGRLTYSLAGNDPGTAKSVPVGGTVTLLDGDDPTAWIRLTRNGVAKAGTATIQFHEQFSNVFAMNDAAEAESAAGGTRYRAVMVRSYSDVTSLKFWLSSLATQATSSAAQLGSSGSGTVGAAAGSFKDWPQKGFAHIRTSGGTTREIVYYGTRTAAALTITAGGRGLLGTSAAAGSASDTIDCVSPYHIGWEDASPTTEGNVQTIANESTAPSGITWSTAITQAAGIGPSGTLKEKRQGALWLRRTLQAGIEGFSRHEARVSYAATVGGQTYTGTLAGLFRVADDSLERYELHIGVGDLPDLSDAPDETFTSFPHTTSATLAPNTVNYLVVNRRNRYDLVSKSLNTTVIAVNSGGDEVNPPPSGPLNVSWKAAAGGKFSLSAIYLHFQDDAPADQWAIYLRTNGTDPDPGIDTPTLVDMVDSGNGASYLVDYLTIAYVAGTDGRVLLRTKRSSDGKFSENDEVLQATAVAGSIAAVSGAAFQRGVAEVLP